MNNLRTASQQALEVEADRRRKALAAEMRAALAQQANPPGCDHCNHPLYAATKCRVCGRVTEQAEPTRSQQMADARFTRRPSLWPLQAREALELIAAPQRPDGTWNRDREACRQIAAEALGRYDDE